MTEHPGPDEAAAQRAALREEIRRILHDVNTGKICPDDTDPTRYPEMADAVIERLGDPGERFMSGYRNGSARARHEFTVAEDLDSIIIGRLRGIVRERNDLRAELFTLRAGRAAVATRWECQHGQPPQTCRLCEGIRQRQPFASISDRSGLYHPPSEVCVHCASPARLASVDPVVDCAREECPHVSDSVRCGHDRRHRFDDGACREYEAADLDPTEVREWLDGSTDPGPGPVDDPRRLGERVRGLRALVVLRELVVAVDDDHAGDMTSLWAEARALLGGES